MKARQLLLCRCVGALVLAIGLTHPAAYGADAMGHPRVTHIWVYQIHSEFKALELELPSLSVVDKLPFAEGEADSASEQPITTQDASGRLLASEDRPKMIWQWPDRQRVGPIRTGAFAWGLCAALSLDGRTLSYVSADDTCIRENVTSGKVLGEFPLREKSDEMTLFAPVWVDARHAWCAVEPNEGGPERGLLIEVGGRRARTVCEIPNMGIWGGYSVSREGMVAALVSPDIDAQHDDQPLAQTISLLQPKADTVAIRPIWNQASPKGGGNIYALGFAGRLLLVAQDCSGPTGRPARVRILGIDCDTGQVRWQASYGVYVEFVRVDPGGGLSLWKISRGWFARPEHYPALWCVDLRNGVPDVIGQMQHVRLPKTWE